MKHRYWIGQSGIIILSLSLMIFGCTPSVGDGNIAESYTGSDLPPFIESVSPADGSLMSIAQYKSSLENHDFARRGVSVTVLPYRVDFASPDIQPIGERIALWVDGECISNVTDFAFGDGLVLLTATDENEKEYSIPGGPYYFSWNPNLSPGKHEARFLLTDNSGERYEYRWLFEMG